jgi:UPF0755 protein
MGLQGFFRVLEMSMKRALAGAVLLLVLVGLVFAAMAYRWLQAPVAQPGQVLELAVEPGSSARQVATQLRQAGATVSEEALFVWFRLSGQARQIHAGQYEIPGAHNLVQVLDMLVKGQVSMRSVTLVEGWTFAQFRQALAQAPGLRQDTAMLSNAQITSRLGLPPDMSPEGWFFPDTYRYGKGSSDWAVLQQAHSAMQKQLTQVWEGRPADAQQLKSPYELLTLASIVEKETGLPSDRGMVASVFHNRLRIGMRLQTDPTVIYGMGAAFDGNLRRADLQRDTPWNTYTRAGLPPTPIAMPGLAALQAAIAPPPSKALYFVARGDGSSQFSETLTAHNQAVARYQLGR